MTPPMDPRERARRRLAALKGGAALLVSSVLVPANAGCDPIPSPPPGGPFPTSQCTPDEGVANWIFASVQSGAPVSMTLSLNAGDSGLELATTFTVTGGTLQGAPVFDGATLATSRVVTIAIAVDEGATDVVVETGVSCNGDGHAVSFTFNIADLDANGSVFPAAEDVTP